MSASSFDAALARLLAHEGGYSNHPSDPGGPTKYGITIADYRRYVNANATAEDVRAMRIDEAKAIYRARYWNALRCDELPAGLDYAAFDYGVNSGNGRAAGALRRVLRLPDGTGIDSGVIDALRGRDTAALVSALCDERLAFLQRLRTWPVFGRGWSRRVQEVRAASLAMARGGLPSASTAKPISATKPAGGVVVGGGIAAGQAHAAGASPLVVAGIVIAAMIVAIAVVLIVRRRRRAATSPLTNAKAFA